MTVKRRRRDIPLVEKEAAIREWEAQDRTGKKRLCRSHGVSINQFNRWYARREDIVSMCRAMEQGTIAPSRERLRGAGRKPRFPELEASLQAWLGSREAPPPPALLWQRAHELAVELGVPPGDLSDKWYRGFRRRHTTTSKENGENGPRDAV